MHDEKSTNFLFTFFKILYRFVRYTSYFYLKEKNPMKHNTTKKRNRKTINDQKTKNKNQIRTGIQAGSPKSKTPGGGWLI